MTGRAARPATARRGGRGALDRPAVVAVALGITRTEGIDALTMRRIAEELGCSPMALYRHVADRQALLLAMLDDVAAHIRWPAPEADPRAELTALLQTAHDVLHADPWVVPLLVIDGLASPLILPGVERIVAALAGAGLPGPDVVAVHQMLWQFVYGEVLTTHHKRADAWSGQMVRGSDPHTYPALHAAMSAVAEAGPPRDPFPDNLRRLLDGVLPR